LDPVGGNISDVQSMRVREQLEAGYGANIRLVWRVCDVFGRLGSRSHCPFGCGSHHCAEDDTETAVSTSGLAVVYEDLNWL